jgi:hypothetical protein
MCTCAATSSVIRPTIRGNPSTEDNPMQSLLPTARLLAAVAVLFFTASVVARGPNAVKRIPRIDGDWWQVASNPDLGVLNSDEQEPVDFGVWPAADGTWQL